MEQFQNSAEFTLKSVQIAALGETDGYEIKQMINTISYVESITSPFVAATMSIADSAGLLNDLPIQGGETVKITVQTTSSERPQEYTFLVWKIGNRATKNNTQVYTLGLLSEEALNNEYVRVFKPLKGNVRDIVAKLLSEDLKSKKTLTSEPTKFDVKMIPANRRPFDLISSLSVKSVPSTSSTPKNPKSDLKTSNEKQKASGTAGFFFWETKRGYNFYSVDSLLSSKPVNRSGKLVLDSKAWGPYIEKPANISDAAEDRFTISQATFSSDVDVMTSMRKGKYSSLMVFFNHSTGQYSEYHYSIADAYKDMEHLGPQNTPTILKATDGRLISDYPTRIVSSFLDHETWYNEPGIASYEETDGSQSPSNFCDFHKHFAAQSLMRYELLKNQLATIVIPGNSEICAGDKIDIKLVNKKPGEEIEKQPYDQESSGVYLIGEVTHTYDATGGANGRFLTTLRLMRDSFGDTESNHGTKTK
jgi:hypothetical protein